MAFEKVEKEILTSDIILNDVKYNMKMFRSISGMNIDITIFSVSYLITFSIIFCTHSPFALFLLLIPIGYLIIKWHLKFKKRESLTVNDLTVDTDTLTSVHESIAGVGRKLGRYQKQIVCYFEGGAEWKVATRNYTWSKLYNLSLEGIVNTSLQGDTFYVVKLNSTGQTIVAYNTKFFDYRKT